MWELQCDSVAGCIVRSCDSVAWRLIRENGTKKQASLRSPCLVAALSGICLLASVARRGPKRTRGLRFSSQPIVRLRVLKDSTSFSTEADSASDVIGTKELSSAPQVFNADVRSSVVLSVDVLSHPSSLLEMHGAYPHRPRSSSSSLSATPSPEDLRLH